MMHELAQLTIDDVLSFHNDLEENSIPTEKGLRDYSLLESAVNAPFQTFMGEDLYPDVINKAAHFCYGLSLNHPFIDGNKRVAVHTMLAYLLLNEIDIAYTQDELYEMSMAIAKGDMSCNELGYWLRTRLKENN